MRARGKPAPEQIFDFTEQRCLLGGHEGDCFAARSGTPSPPNAMHIVLGDMGQIEIDNVREAVDVEAACGDVRCHQNPNFSPLEARERARTSILALVAVYRGRCYLLTLELSRKPISTVLRTCEDEHLLPSAAMDQFHEQVGLAASISGVDDLIHQLGSAVSRRYLDETG